MSTRAAVALIAVLGGVTYSLATDIIDTQQDLTRLRERITQLESPAPRPSPRADRARPLTPALLPAAPSHLPRSRVQGNGQQRGLNWTALAECESSGDPRAVSPSGKYRGLVQFSLASWRYVGMTGDPIDYPAAVQIEAAKRLYALQGRAAWPYCGRFL